MSEDNSSEDLSFPASVREHIDRICRDFEAAWQAGDHPRIEDYIGVVEGLERTELLHQLLLLDLDYRRKAGDQPTSQEYCERFPADDRLIDGAFHRYPTQTTPNPQRAGPRPGTKVPYFGDYELLEVIAHGGMGVVYKARQISLNRIVALKMIRAGGLASEQEIRRFSVEAEAVANLDHPNIVTLYEVGQHEGQHYFSMAYLDGQSLADLLREQLPATRTAAEYVKTVAEAIHYAHQRGVLHRDIKPGNVLIDRSGHIRITDFGLAKRMDHDSHLTRDFQVLGTPGYMPPEQALGQHDRVGPTADVYSLGALLYALLTGHPPFRAASREATLERVVDADPTPCRDIRPEIESDLETIALKCLEKEPAHRFADAKELVDELQRFLDGTPIVSRPISEREWIERWANKKGYDISDELGEGLTGIVFRARHRTLDRTVALKVFHPPKAPEELKSETTETWVFDPPLELAPVPEEFSSAEEWLKELERESAEHIAKWTNSDEIRRRELERFNKKVKAIAQFQYPNIVTIYEFGSFGERPFLSMELVDGGSFHDKVATTQAEIRQITSQLVSVADAIDFANRAGVIHRDLNPRKVLLTTNGAPKITGFTVLVSEDEMVGRLAFMAPETLCPGDSISSQTDVYGLGAILYYLLTGCPPFQGATHGETIRQVRYGEPIAPRQLKPSIGPDLEAICLKCIEKDPNRRYVTASEFAADLGRYLRGEKTFARKSCLPVRVYRWCKRRPTKP